MKTSLTIKSLLPAVLLGMLPMFAPAQDQLEPGDTFRDCPECPEMVVVPAGSFMMGSPDSEEGRDYDEGPVHKVTIAKPFAVGVYEVTFDEWDACVSAGGCGGYRPYDGSLWGDGSKEGSWGRGSRPVINVSWNDAQAYVKWLSSETGKTYRLLSESEWEYAARAGSTGRYHWGNRISTRKANYGGKDNIGQTTPVGSYQPNAFGLYDVHGNVYEWLEDCWNDSYEGAPTDGGVWEDGDCNKAVLRGGSRGSNPQNLRAADRNRSSTGMRRSAYAGFRVARTLAP